MKAFAFLLLFILTFFHMNISFLIAKPQDFFGCALDGLDWNFFELRNDISVWSGKISQQSLAGAPYRTMVPQSIAGTPYRTMVPQ